MSGEKDWKVKGLFKISHILIAVYMFGLFVGNNLVVTKHAVFICFKEFLFCQCEVALMCFNLIICFLFVHLENMSLPLKYIIL